MNCVVVYRQRHLVVLVLTTSTAFFDEVHHGILTSALSCINSTPSLCIGFSPIAYPYWFCLSKLIMSNSEIAVTDSQALTDLTAQLSSLARTLDTVSLQTDDFPTTAQSLLQSSKPRTLTRLELIQIILSLQEIQNIQMDRLQQFVDRLVEPSDAEEEAYKENKQPLTAAVSSFDKQQVKGSGASSKDRAPQQQNRHWSVGRPLETLVEMEQENNDTPNSTSAADSFFSIATAATTTSSAVRASSAGSNSSTHKQEATVCSSSSKLVGAKPHHVHFQDEVIPSFAQMSQDAEKRNAKKEATSERVESQHVTTTAAEGVGDASFLTSTAQSYVDENTVYDDDSALYCPTVIATSDRPKPTYTAKDLPHSLRGDDEVRAACHRTQAPPSTPMDHRLMSHIDVDMSLSPAPTVLTMDASTCGYWGDQSLAGDEDIGSVCSEETPVLDRYRVELSPQGIVVMPNQRGTHSRRLHQQRSLLTSATTKSVSKLPPPRQSHIPTSIGKSTVYRKTPYRQVRSMQPTTPTIDENEPLSGGQNLLDQYDLDDDDSLLLSPVSSPKRANHSSRPVANQGGGGDVFFPLDDAADDSFSRSIDSDQRDYQSLSSSMLYAPAHMDVFKPTDSSGSLKSPRRHSSVMTPPTPAQLPIDFKSPFSTSGQPVPTRRRFTLTHTQSLDSLRHIRSVSQQDYDDAPRVVQMQVTLAEVDATIQLINSSLDMGIVVARFTETRAKSLLQPLGFSQRKCKTVLMSLCHWRRLIMRRVSEVGGPSDDMGLVFQVAGQV
jgi:hypothetical protein